MPNKGDGVIKTICRDLAGMKKAIDELRAQVDQATKLAQMGKYFGSGGDTSTPPPAASPAGAAAIVAPPMAPQSSLFLPSTPPRSFMDDVFSGPDKGASQRKRKDYDGGQGSGDWADIRRLAEEVKLEIAAEANANAVTQVIAPRGAGPTDPSAIASALDQAASKSSAQDDGKQGAPTPPPSSGKVDLRKEYKLLRDMGDDEVVDNVSEKVAKSLTTGRLAGTLGNWVQLAVLKHLANYIPGVGGMVGAMVNVTPTINRLIMGGAISQVTAAVDLIIRAPEFAQKVIEGLRDTADFAGIIVTILKDKFPSLSSLEDGLSTDVAFWDKQVAEIRSSIGSLGDAWDYNKARAVLGIPYNKDENTEYQDRAKEYRRQEDLMKSKFDHWLDRKSSTAKALFIEDKADDWANWIQKNFAMGIGW